MKGFKVFIIQKRFCPCLFGQMRKQLNNGEIWRHTVTPSPKAGNLYSGIIDSGSPKPCVIMECSIELKLHQIASPSMAGSLIDGGRVSYDGLQLIRLFTLNRPGNYYTVLAFRYFVSLLINSVKLSIIDVFKFLIKSPNVIIWSFIIYLNSSSFNCCLTNSGFNKFVVSVGNTLLK